MKKTNKLISILLVLAMLLSMAPVTVFAAADTSAYAPTRRENYFNDYDAIFANGTAITIEAAPNGTRVWYMDGGTKKYVTNNGENGEDLSAWYIFVGSENADGMNGVDGSVTMTGGTVDTIYAGQDFGYFSGTSNITIIGGTVSNHIFCNSRTASSATNDYIKTITIYDATGAKIDTGYAGKADNVVQKKGTSWNVSGNGVVPSGVTLKVADGETLNVPIGATLANNGTIVKDNGGAILVKGKLTGNAPENYVKPIGISIADTALEANVPVTLSPESNPADCVLTPWYTFAVTDDSPVTATIDGTTVTAHGGGTLKLLATLNDGYSEPVQREVSFNVSFTPVSGINGMPAEGWVNTDIILPSSASPDNASYTDIEWSVADANGTGASVSGNVLKAPNVGTVTLLATVRNGKAYGTDYIQTFTVNLKASEKIDFSLYGDSVTITEKDADTVTVTYAGFSGGSRDFAVDEPIIMTGSYTGGKYKGAIVTVESGNPTIVLDNLNLTSNTYLGMAFIVKKGATVNMRLVGESTLTVDYKKYNAAPIEVNLGATLIISGEGRLNAVRSSNAGSGVCIGGSWYGGVNCGTLVFNGGTVVANHYIGAYSGEYQAAIVINGGNVKYRQKMTGTLTDDDGNALVLNTVTLDGATEGTAVTAIKGVDYGLEGLKTIDTNKLYIYLPADTVATTLTAGGKEYICNRNLTYYTSHDWSDASGICTGCGYECDHAGQSSEFCGICGTSLHTHSFTYSASGDTITAVCENTDGNCPDSEGTLTILAPADLYADGTTAKEATIENNLVDTSVAISDITYSAPYGLPPKDAGTYTASVTVGGATATVEFTLLNYAAKVTDKDGNAVGTYKTFADAITAASASEGSTVTLLDDITLTKQQVIRSGKLTLDLNGNNLVNETDRVFYIYEEVDLTIKDSGEGGTLERADTGGYAICNYGTLTVESGVIKGDGGIDNEGTLTFKDGTVEAVTYSAISNFGTAYVYNGVLKSSDAAAIENFGTLYVYDGEIDGVLNDGTAYISGGKIDRDDYAAFNLFGGMVEVTGGSFTGTDYEYGDYSGTPFGEYTVCYNEDATLVLKGGEFPNGFVVANTTANTFLAEDYYYKDADGKLIDVADDAKVIDGYVKVSKGADLADAVITLDSTEFTYNGSEIKPTVIVTIGGKTLTEGKDYTLTFANNVNAGTATVTIKAVGQAAGGIAGGGEDIGNSSNSGDITESVYTGEATKEFTINKKPVTVTATAPDKVYDGTTDIDYDTIVITFNGIVDGDTVGYTIKEAWYNGIVVGTDWFVSIVYNVTGEDANNYMFPEVGECIAPDYFVEATADITAKDISDGFIILGDALTYNGKEQTQTVEKVLPTGTAPEATYTVSGNKATNVGVYLLTVTGTGNFTGEAKIAFEIALDDDCISHLDRVEDNGVMKWNVKSTDRESLEYIVDQLNNAVTDIADADKKNEWADIKEACEDMLRIINSIELFIADVEEDYAEFDIETVKSSDIPALDKLVSKVNEIKDRYGFNLTDEEEKKLEDILDGIEKLKAKIDETADEIARIDEAVNGYDKETVTSDDVPELSKLIEDINALTDGDNLTEDEKAALEETEKAIDDLVEKLAEVAEEIKKADEAVKSYDEETVKSTDSDELAQLKEDIQNLIDSDNTTENEKTALEEMIKDIEGLEDKITETEEKLEEIKGIENNYNPENISSDDKAAIEDKIAEIEAVNPDNLTEEQKAEYEEIKAGFEALLEEIAAAEKNVADIGVELEMFDEKRVTIFWEDDIEALKAKIDELLADENMGETEKAKLNEYKAQAEKLIEIINTPKEYFSLRFFYLIWDCLTWKYNGILWLFSKIFGC